MHIKCISICSTYEKKPSKNKSCIGCIAWHGILYFLKSLRSLEEFRKNPHVKIPPKSPSTNFQSLAIIKNQIFIRKRIFLHFRPIRPSGQPAYSASRPTPPPDLCSVARPSWPAQGSRLPPCDHGCRNLPHVPSLYGRPLPLLNPSHNQDLQPLFAPPTLIPTAGRSRIPCPGARTPPPRPLKKVSTTPGLHHTSPAHSPPFPKPVLPGC
jgi:hypothetical protein